jgi:hypothetical protein
MFVMFGAAHKRERSFVLLINVLFDFGAAGKLDG